jgi:hypothetical protein
VEGETTFEPPADQEQDPKNQQPTVRLKRLIDEDTPFFLE